MQKHSIARAVSGARWNPRDGLIGSDQGLWLDPSDLTTLFQDAAGTTPVTAVEQPVGLMLDKSKSLVLGPELVANGGFAGVANGTDATTLPGWAAYGTPTNRDIQSEQLRITASAGGQGVRLTFPTSAGKWYLLKAAATGDLGIAGMYSDYTGDISTVGGKVGIYFVATGTSATIFFRAANNNSIGTTYYDNISVRELPGNHAYQTTSTKRPVLSARVNLLTKTEDFAAADWIKLGTSAPNADTLLELAVSGLHRVSQSKNVPATKCCLYAEFYPAGRSSCSLSLYDASGGTTRAGAIFSIDGAGSIISGSTTLNKISLLPDGWYGCYIESASAFSGGNTTVNIGAANGTAESYVGDATKGVRVRKVDLRPVNTGVNLPAYQRVNTATDYATQGFPTYLKFDGIDDAMQTNSINFTATDKMTVFAGVRKLSDASLGILVELGQITTQTGCFTIANGYLGPNVWNFESKGTTYVSVYPARTAPVTDVLTLQSSINSPTILSTRINGAASGSNTNSQGSGSFNNMPIYIGARADSNFRFNGYLYQLVICGRTTTVPIDQITRTEEFVNRKTKAY